MTPSCVVYIFHATTRKCKVEDLKSFAPLGITARAFCQRHGIRLPYRLTGPDLYSRVGLSQAVEQAIHMQPTSVLLVDHAQANQRDESWRKAKVMLERRGIDSQVYTVE